MTRLATVAMASAVVIGSASFPSTVAAGDDTVLDRAGRAAAEVSFVGAISVSWYDGTQTHRDTLLVEAGGGSVMVRGEKDLLVSPARDLFVRAGASDWNLLWPSGVAMAGRPALGGKYTLTEGPGPVVAGRTSRSVEVTEGEVVRERLQVDVETGLLLRREQLEPGLGAVRTIGFESITIEPGSTPITNPARSHGQAARSVAVADLPSTYPAPAALDDGYRRLGVYDHDGVAHVLYGDGLYELSVFQERGRLDLSGLPDDRQPVPVGESTGWHYQWAGGHVVIWEAGRVVFAAVSDAPFEHLVGAVRSLPAGSAASSLVHRFQRVCRALLLPLAG